MARQVNRIIWHHSAGSTMSGAVAAMEAKSCHYHRLIDKDGSVYRMRDYELLAYHAGPNGNTASIGICLIGDFRYTRPTVAQLETARDMAIEIEELYGAVQYQNHCDVAATACPVVDLAAQVRDLVLTKQKDRDTQSDHVFTDEEIDLIYAAHKCGFIDVEDEAGKLDVTRFDYALYPFIEMLMALYNNLIYQMDTKFKETKKEKPKNDKNGKAES